MVGGGLLGRAVARIANLGVLSSEGAETRRVQAFNLTALAAFVLNTSFTVLWIALDAAAADPILLPNTLSSLGYALALFLSCRRRHTLALWVLTPSAFINLTLVSVFFGFDSIGWLYMILLPVLGALFAPRGSPLALFVLIGAGSMLFGVLPLIAADEVADPQSPQDLSWRTSVCQTTLCGPLDLAGNPSVSLGNRRT